MAVVLAQYRVVLGRMPRLLHDIIESVLQQTPDIALVGDLDEGDDPVALVRHARADVVVVGMENDHLAIPYLDLMRELCRVRVLGIAAHGRRAFLYELRPFRIPLGELSPAELLNA